MKNLDLTLTSFVKLDFEQNITPELGLIFSRIRARCPYLCLNGAIKPLYILETTTFSEDEPQSTAKLINIPN